MESNGTDLFWELASSGQQKNCSFQHKCKKKIWLQRLALEEDVKYL